MRAPVLFSGVQPYPLSQACNVHIPVPGLSGLSLQLHPRCSAPASGSAAALFVHYAADDQYLRLDYGYSNRTRAVHYHWQRDRTHADAMLSRRSCVRDVGPSQGTRCYRFRGRTLLLLGRAVSEVALLESERVLPPARADVRAYALEEVALV